MIATADTASMKRLTDAGLVEAPDHLRPEQARRSWSSPGNPKGITGLADLARTDIKLVLGDETVPFGRFAAAGAAGGRGDGRARCRRSPT